jgi:acetate kinase
LAGAGFEGLTGEAEIADQAAAVAWCLEQLQSRGLGFDAVGFKAVHGGRTAEPVRVDEGVLATMAAFTDAAPAHNPAYIAAMKAFAEQRAELPLVAAFETGFHQTIPASRTTYAIPREWTEQFGVRRYGFHGASHRYIAQRAAELLGRDDLRIVSCHLGGSSSLCALDGGRSVGNSFGMTPQAGVPQNNRVGDIDLYTLLPLMKRTGESAEALLGTLAKRGGLLGISGLSNEMPELLAAAEDGHAGARLAVDCFVEGVRHYLGAYAVALGGVDAVVFTGGIGERSPAVRAAVCAGLGFLGLELDAAKNEQGRGECALQADTSAGQIWVIPTNEELIVARQTQAVVAA